MKFLQILGAVLIGAVVVLGKWYQVRSAEAEKEHKAGIQTIFNGKK